MDVNILVAAYNLHFNLDVELMIFRTARVCPLRFQTARTGFLG